MKTPEQSAAMLRVMSLAAQRPERGAAPEALANWATTMADARSALCLAHGIPPEFISAGGYDITDASYARVRASWVHHIGQWGLTMFENGPEWALGLWKRDRPDLADGDDWRKAGTAAHEARYPGGCDRESCDICHGAEPA